MSFNKLIESSIMKVTNFILKHKNYTLFDGLIHLVLPWFKYLMDSFSRFCEYRMKNRK